MILTVRFFKAMKYFGGLFVATSYVKLKWYKFI